MLGLTKRASITELLDQPDIPRRELERSLYDLEVANRWLGGRRAMLRHVLPLVGETFDVLDVGCGSADTLRALSEHASRNGCRIGLTGVDTSASILEIARSRNLGSSEMDLIQAGATSLPFDDSSFDIVVSSLVLHHLAPNDVVAALQEARRVTRSRIVVTDLVRSHMAFASALIVGTFVFGKLSRYDAPASVRRAYTPVELLSLANEAGLKDCRIFKGPVRMALVYDKERT
jgi:ubiquinone/menaquinone biosynthesis C-methylase UbiE